MYMYRAAVHSLDAEFTVLEMTTIHTCFYLANVSDEINFFRAGLRLQFRTRSDRQHELFVTI